MRLFGFGKKKTNQEKVTPKNTWHVEGIASRVVIEDDRIENVKITDLQTSVRFINTSWSSELLIQLAQHGFTIEDELDGTSKVKLPIGSHALLRDINDITEAYIIDTAVYAKLTSEGYERFTFAPDMYNITAYKTHANIKVPVYRSEKPFSKQEAELLIEASKYCDFIHVLEKENTIVIDLKDDITLERNIDEDNDSSHVNISSDKRNVFIQINEGDEKKEVLIFDPYTISVKEVAHAWGRPQVYLSSISQLKKGDNVSVVGKDGTTVVKTIIRSLNKRESRVYLEDYKGIAEGMTFVLDEEDTVYIPSTIKKVKYPEEGSTTAGLHAKVVTSDGAGKERSILSKFIRVPREGETIEDVIYEVLENEFPGYHEKPYKYWRQ